MQIAAVLATFLPLWESREVLVRIMVQALSCNKASPESMAKFGSFMGKPGVPRVRVSPLTPFLVSCSKVAKSRAFSCLCCRLGCIHTHVLTRSSLPQIDLCMPDMWYVSHGSPFARRTAPRTLLTVTCTLLLKNARGCGNPAGGSATRFSCARVTSGNTRGDASSACLIGWNMILVRACDMRKMLEGTTAAHA